MLYEVKKAENCFVSSQTYEYALPLSGQELLPLLQGWAVRENHSFRRPVFAAERGGVQIKGILSAHSIKVSYPEEDWADEKSAFEAWLAAQEEDPGRTPAN